MSTEIAEPTIEELDEIDISDAFSAFLILFNDDDNSMEHVIACLMNICKLDFTMATSKMSEAHNKGRVLIKAGDYEKIKTEAYLLAENNLTVEIQ